LKNKKLTFQKYRKSRHIGTAISNFWNYWKIVLFPALVILTRSNLSKGMNWFCSSFFKKKTIKQITFTHLIRHHHPLIFLKKYSMYCLFSNIQCLGPV
jgi:hypothetical protein